MQAESPLLTECRRCSHLRPSASAANDDRSKSPERPINFNKHYHQTDLLSQTPPPSPTSTSKFGQLITDYRRMEKVDIIQRINGEFGRWQLRAVLLIFLCKIPSSWFMACIIFTAPAPRHGEFFCKPQLETANWTRSVSSPFDEVKRNKTDWIKIMHPIIEAKDNEFKIDFCNVYDDADEHAEKYFHNRNYSHPWDRPTERNSTVVPCDSFLHHSSYKSIITDYDLVCSRDILVATTQFFHLFGVLTGGILAYNLLKM